MSDVARVAGVSAATVSRVINSDPAVAESRRIAVQEAIARLGYRPHSAARALRIGRSRAIGVVVPSLRNRTSAEFTEAVAAGLGAEGYVVSLVNSMRDPQIEEIGVRSLLERNFDAVVVLNPQNVTLLASLMSEGILVIGALRTPESALLPFPAVLIDDVSAVRDLFAHLEEMGHREIAYLRIPMTVGDTGRPAFFGEAERRGINITRYRLPRSEGADPQFRETLEAHLREIVAMSPRPTCLITTQEFAPFALRHLRDVGIRVPDEMSLVVFGSSVWADLLDPPVDSMETDYTELGEKTARQLMRMLHNASPEPPDPVVTSYVRRGSVTLATPR